MKNLIRMGLVVGLCGLMACGGAAPPGQASGSIEAVGDAGAGDAPVDCEDIVYRYTSAYEAASALYQADGGLTPSQWNASLSPQYSPPCIVELTSDGCSSDFVHQCTF